MRHLLFRLLTGVLVIPAICGGSVLAQEDVQAPRVTVRPRLATASRAVLHHPVADAWADGDLEPPPVRIGGSAVESLLAPSKTASLRQPEFLQANWEFSDHDPVDPFIDDLEPHLEAVPQVNAVPRADDPVPIPLPDQRFETNHQLPAFYDDAELMQLRERVIELERDRELRLLTERVREAEAADCGVDVTDAPWVHTWGGRMQADVINWPYDDEFGGQPNYVEFRRLRLFCAGEGYGVWDYKLEFDLANEERRDAEVIGGRVDLTDFGVELKDAYLGIHDVPGLGYVRLGHFMVPFGLEQLTSSNRITFMERGLPRVFLPGREFGIAAYRYLPESNITWACGAFYHDFSDTALAIEDDNQGMRAGLRGTWTPWYDEPTDGRYVLHTGMSYYYTRHSDGDVRFRSRPEIHRGDWLIDTGLLPAAETQQLGTELAWVHGPLSLQTELIWTYMGDVGPGGTSLVGAYAYASLFLTGEYRPYNREEGVFGRVQPYENFWVVDTCRGPAAGKGAWELALRWSSLDFTDIDGQQLHDLTVGMNWYWNPNARLMFNWIHPFRRDNLIGNTQGDVLGMRFQVDF